MLTHSVYSPIELSVQPNRVQISIELRLKSKRGPVKLSVLSDSIRICDRNLIHSWLPMTWPNCGQNSIRLRSLATRSLTATIRLNFSRNPVEI